MTRVAAAQLAAGTDVAANLAACLRMIDAAAAAAPNSWCCPSSVITYRGTPIATTRTEWPADWATPS